MKKALLALSVIFILATSLISFSSVSYATDNGDIDEINVVHPVK